MLPKRAVGEKVFSNGELSPDGALEEIAGEADRRFASTAEQQTQAAQKQ